MMLVSKWRTSQLVSNKNLLKSLSIVWKKFSIRKWTRSQHSSLRMSSSKKIKLIQQSSRNCKVRSRNQRSTNNSTRSKKLRSSGTVESRLTWVDMRRKQISLWSQDQATMILALVVDHKPARAKIKKTRPKGKVWECWNKQFMACLKKTALRAMLVMKFHSTRLWAAF